MKKFALVLILLILFAGLYLFIGVQNLKAQEPKDHPALSRYEGAEIVAYQVRDYIPYVLGTGDQKEKQFRGHGKYFSSYIDLEGKLTRIQYQVPLQEGIYKVFKNYENALKNAGYQILFTTSDKESSWPFWNEEVYHHERGINPIRGRDFIGPFGREGFRFLTAKGTYKENDIYFAIFINPDEDDVLGDHVLITQDVIEVNPMESGLVTAKKIEDNIDLSGFISIYGIHFETNKWSIKKESEPALEEIASFLQKNNEEKFYIVGHTDNVGDLAYNMDLSKKRAKSVMDKLINEYGIQEQQLEAYGVASLSPVTSNSNEAGKARNRRVEIVKQ